MIFDVVEYLDSTGEVMVARMPQAGYGDFTTGSQLIVHENQVCVFYYNGQIADQFTAGRYTLTTENLPVIKTLSKLVFKGKTPFRAFVNFVNLKTFLNMKWGTPQAVLLRDADLGGVPVRAFGAFSIKVRDHLAFLNTIVGTQGLQETARVQDYMKRIIVSRFSDALASMFKSAYEIQAHRREIESRVKLEVAEDFTQYGLALVDLIIESINLPEDLMARIEGAAGTRAFSDRDVDKYQRIQVADALRDAAQAGGASEVAAGMGLGAGIAVGGQLAGALGGAQQQRPAQPAGSAAQAAGPTCPKCHNPVEKEFVLCPICKFRLKRPCVNVDCKKMLEAGWDACPYCGTDQPQA